LILEEKKAEADFKLLNFLEKEKLISEENARLFYQEASKLGTTPLELLLANNEIEEKKIIDILSEKLGFNKVSLSTASISQDATKLVNKEFALNHLFFPVKIKQNALIVAMFNPFQVDSIVEIEKRTGYFVKTVLATKSDILDSIEIFYQDKEAFIENIVLNTSVIDKNSDMKLLNFLENSELLSHEKIKSLQQQSKITNRSPIDIGIELKDIDEDNLVDLLSKKLFIQKINLSSIENVDKKVLDIIPQHFALANFCFPIEISKDISQVDKLVLAIFNPFSDALKDIEKYSKNPISLKLATRKEIIESIKFFYDKHNKTRKEGQSTLMSNLLSSLAKIETESSSYQKTPISLDNNSENKDVKLSDVASSLLSSQEEISDDVFEIRKPDEKDEANFYEFTFGEVPVVKLVNKIIYDAINIKASDIHIEAAPSNVLIRYRIDGVLHSIRKIPKNLQNGLISRIKILSKMDISEKRVPQDGNLKARLKNKDVDIRVSTLPTQYGEKAVLRVLDTTSIRLRIDSLGFSESNFSILKNSLDQPQGMIIVTGPTGSGKTSTLYACINELNSPEVNIVTIEDPVEYSIGGINQVQLNKKAGLTFGNTLKSILRQDPDIVMIGEVRDTETAEIAFNASMTGHLVLSSLHTNDSVSAVTRLLDLHIPHFLISSSLLLVVAQRLVRRNCFRVY
jgi:type II secretory ATPase GspE/PulE/Tfp pilus assembly ATPase PilB-like protein